MGQPRSFACALMFLLATVFSHSTRADEGNGSIPAVGREPVARLECIMPDGRNARVSFESDPESSIRMADDESVTWPLGEGDTTFVVALPRTTMLERLSFINENATARGELEIAVSNDHLPAASDRWIPVDGAIAFTRKRLFNLSLVGVEAKYVRLVFHVQGEGRLASFGLYRAATAAELAGPLLQVSDHPSSKDSARTLRFNFANLYAGACSGYFDSDCNVLAFRPADGDTRPASNLASKELHSALVADSP